jgi:hypothetical protein
VVTRLREGGAWVASADPYVPAIAVGGFNLKAIEPTPTLFADSDGVVILTDRRSITRDSSSSSLAFAARASPSARSRLAASRRNDGMIAKDKVAAFLLAHRGRAFCERCLARALGIDPSTGHRAATKVARVGFIREFGVCSECRESRLVTQAPPER